MNGMETRLFHKYKYIVSVFKFARFRDIQVETRFIASLIYRVSRSSRLLFIASLVHRVFYLSRLSFIASIL